MPIHEGLFIRLDGTTFIRHVHAAVAGYQLGTPESPRYERTTGLDPDGRVIFMPTTLRQRTDRDEPIELVATRRVEIRGWRAAEVERTLREAGFPSIEMYGAYDKAPFEAAESRDVIVVAR